MCGVVPNWTLTPDLPAIKMLPTAPWRPLHLNGNDHPERRRRRAESPAVKSPLSRTLLRGRTLRYSLRRNRRPPHIQVAAATLLHRLFGEDCATVERRQDGDSLVYTWAATRFDCAIRWEEFA